MLPNLWVIFLYSHFEEHVIRAVAFTFNILIGGGYYRMYIVKVRMHRLFSPSSVDKFILTNLMYSKCFHVSELSPPPLKNWEKNQIDLLQLGTDKLDNIVVFNKSVYLNRLTNFQLLYANLSVFARAFICVFNFSNQATEWGDRKLNLKRPYSFYLSLSVCPSKSVTTWSDSLKKSIYFLCIFVNDCEGIKSDTGRRNETQPFQKISRSSSLFIHFPPSLTSCEQICTCIALELLGFIS